MNFLFGKSAAAIRLELLVQRDDRLQAKVMRHISEYNHYVEVVSSISDRKVRIKALDSNLNCNLDVSQEVKAFIRNVKIAKRRECILKDK